MSTPIVLDRDDRRPLYKQIEDQLRAAILDGRLRPGAQLPGVRTLAAELGVARITVVGAYEQLAAEGYVVGRVGYGTHVASELPEGALLSDRRPAALIAAERLPRRLEGPGEPGQPGPSREPRLRRLGTGGPPGQRPLGFRTAPGVGPGPSSQRGGPAARGQAPGPRPPDTRWDGRPPDLPSANPWLPSSAAALDARREKPLAYDFRQWRFGIELFPGELWERCLRFAWRELSRDGLASSGAETRLLGDPLLREVIAAYIGAARSVRCTSDEVIVTTGAQAASALAARVWLGPDRLCVVEEPGHPYVRQAIVVSGARIAHAPVDAEGIRTDGLPAAAAMAVVSPSWQFPGGGTLTMERRLDLLGWAERAGALMLETDRDSEFRYSGPPLPSLQGLDRDGRVLYLNGFARLMPPGLGVGYVVLPPELVERFAAMAAAHGDAPSLVEQRALARFIADGHFDRHVKRARTALQERQAALVEAIRDELGGRLTVGPAEAGTHVVATIEDPAWTGTALAQRARSVGVGVSPMAEFRSLPAPDRELVLSYASLTPTHIRQGIRRLSRVLAGLPATAGGPSGQAPVKRPPPWSRSRPSLP